VHIAVVVDKYGTTEGLVILTDVIEAIAGDLPERGEDSEPRIVQRDDGSWLADGTIPTDEVETITGIAMGKDVKMLAGFMQEHLGRIPEASTSIIYGKARFEVVDMDGNRIDKVLIEIDRAAPKRTTPLTHDQWIRRIIRRSCMKRPDVQIFIRRHPAMLNIGHPLF
jgi:putative hemolysin